MMRVEISLSDDLDHWVRERAAEGGYGDPADDVVELVRREREYEEKHARLQAAIYEGRASGVSDRDPFEYIDELRAGLRRRSESADAA